MGLSVTDLINFISWSYSFLFKKHSIIITPFSPTMNPPDVACGIPLVVSVSTVDGCIAYTASASLCNFSSTVFPSQIGTCGGSAYCAATGKEIIIDKQR